MRKSGLILLLLLVASAASSPVRAGDEDVKQEKVVVPPAEPDPTPLPETPDAPGMSLGDDVAPASPEFSLTPDEPAAPAKSKAAQRKAWDPDTNMDYSELLSMVEPVEAARGVLPPALGSRGYRPNLIAVGAGDRTPGYGGMIEYSWNRLGAGVFYSYRNLQSADVLSESQSFGGGYLVYRWLPFTFSPYILAGVEFGSATPETFGGLTGIGLEAQIYSGWTLLFGYTYHSTARKGFYGGAFGWAF